MAATIRIIVSTEGGIGQVQKDIASLGTTAQGAGGGFNSLKEIATGALRQVGVMAVNVGAMAAQAMAGFVKDSISAAGDFEGKMNEFNAAAGGAMDAAGLKTKDFSDLFLQLGKELPVSTGEVQDAAIALIKGGLDPAVIAAGGLKSSLQFAAAAGMDLAGAAELSVKQLGTFVSFSASAEEKTAFLAESQNLLVKAANASTLNVDKLGDALLAAGGSAKASGVEYQDFVTTMGLISPQFSSAAEAGTSYKNFLTRLIPTTQNAKDAMFALGLATKDGKSAFYDANGAFIGNAAAAQLLKEKLGPLTAEERASAVATIFGNDAKNAALALMDAGSAGYDAFAASMAAANGVQEQSAATQQGFNFAMENFKGTIEALQITLGTMLLPVLTQFMEQANQGLGVVMGLADGSITLDQAWAMLTANITMGGGQFSAAFAVISTVFDALQTTALMIFGTLQTYIPAVMLVIQAVIGAVLTQVAAFWTAHGTEVMAFITTTWATISTIYNTALALILSVVIGVLQVVAEFITEHGAQIQTVLTGAWQIISGVITAVLAVIQGVITAALAIIQGDWQGAWTAIQTMTSTFVSAAGSVITGFLNMIAAVFGTSMDEIGATWSNIFSTMGEIALKFVSRASSLGADIINGIVEGVVGAAHRLYDAVANVVSSALGSGESAADAHSPARNFMPLGRNMTAGVAVGMLQAAPLVAGAGAAVVGAAHAGATTTNNYSLNFAPNYSGTPRERMDLNFAKSLAGVA